MAKEKFCIYEAVTDKIIAQLEAGVIPWRKPWIYRGKGNQKRMYEGAYNRVSGVSYSPLNQMLLSNIGEYASYKQWIEAGGKPQKNKSEIVVFWKIYPKTVKDEEGNEKNIKIPLLRYINVWHVSNVEGVEPKPIPDEMEIRKKLECQLKPCEQIEEILSSYYKRENISVFDEYGNRAYYDPGLDEIHVPIMNQYKIVEKYYSTKSHETIHSTGHKTRLDRFKSTGVKASFGSESYSEEELVAEMGACFLLAHCGIDTEVIYQNSAAYLNGWATALKAYRRNGDSKKLIVNASKNAKKAIEYILYGRETLNDETEIKN